MSYYDKIYDNFNGYNGYSKISDAEKIIRQRHSENLLHLIEKVTICEKKAKDNGMTTVLEGFTSIKNRMMQVKKEVEERDKTYITEPIKSKITKIDTDKLKEIDFSVAYIMTKSEEMIDNFSLVDTDSHIIEKFSALNKYINELDEKCRRRFTILKEEILQ